MLSSNSAYHSKHRRNRRRVVAAAAVAGAGVALPVLISGTASAASGGSSVWDAVAQCESSGNWSINSGNGFYGGLQFTESTWLANGGGQYAQYANEASPAQQIAVAQKVLASQGPGAWPVCSVKAGLTQSNGGASGSASAPTAASGSTRVQQATPQQQAPEQPSQQSTAATTSSTGGHYTVVKGDTLSKIAKSHNLSGGWEQLYQANKSTVGHNPNLILPGEHLVF